MMLCLKCESDDSQKLIFLKYMCPRCCNDNIKILEHSKLLRSRTSWSYSTNSFTHLYIHICKVEKKYFWKL